MSPSLCVAHAASVEKWTYPKPETARAIARTTGRPYVDLAREQIAAARASCAAGRGCATE